jgi:hypothetical protein
MQVNRKEVRCRIAGIIERNPCAIGPGGAPSVSGVMLTMGLARTIDADIVTNPQSLLRDPGSAKTCAAITVKVKQSQYIQDVEDDLRRMGFQAFSIDDALRGAKTAFILLDLFLSLIGSIAQGEAFIAAKGRSVHGRQDRHTTPAARKWIGKWKLSRLSIHIQDPSRMR